MSETVLSDAQMSMVLPLKPFQGFEDVYQGAEGTVPIAFPGTLDPEAGKEGFAAGLLAGIPVPLGGRLLIMIPMPIHALGDPSANYAYQFVFRIRNQRDVNRKIEAGLQPSAYHLPSEQLGRRLTESMGGTKLFFIPGASDVEAFEQTEPASGAASVNVVQQRYVPKITAPWVQPLTPDGSSGVWQQGVYDRSDATNPSGPTFAPIFLDALGDELLILCYKVDGATWDFNSEGADASFSDTFGNGSGALEYNPNIGILISTGVQGS